MAMMLKSRHSRSAPSAASVALTSHRRAAELEREAGHADKAPVGLMARWSVDLIGKKMRHLGTVVAANEKEAIEAAIKLSTPRDRTRSR
jgi:hypothetical protein